MMIYFVTELVNMIRFCYVCQC